MGGERSCGNRFWIIYFSDEFTSVLQQGILRCASLVGGLSGGGWWLKANIAHWDIDFLDKEFDVFFPKQQNGLLNLEKTIRESVFTHCSFCQIKLQRMDWSLREGRKGGNGYRKIERETDGMGWVRWARDSRRTSRWRAVGQKGQRKTKLERGNKVSSILQLQVCRVINCETSHVGTF